jgi:hypothetical protein
VILHKENSYKNSLPPTKEGSSTKRKSKEKEQRSKGKEVKPHLPIQGHETLHEKREKRGG